MLDLRRLQILCAVARAGSLAAAAKELSYSTPAVWQHMKRLEAEVGQPLFVTHPRGVHLTEAGRVLARHGGEMLDRTRLAEAELAGLMALETGELSVTAFSSAASGLLPEAIARFRAAHPAVRVSLTESEPPEALQRMRDGEADLALVFRYGSQPEEPRTTEFTHVLDDPLHVVLPRDHALATAKSITLDDLRDERRLEGQHMPAALRRNGGSHGVIRRDDLTYSGDDFVTVQELVAAGAGIALIPRLALRATDSDVVVRPLADGGQHRCILAVTRRPAHRNPASQRFLELVLDEARILTARWRESPFPTTTGALQA